MLLGLSSRIKEALLGTCSFLVFLAFIQHGMFTADENVYLYLAASIAENFPHFLDLSAYFKGMTLTSSHMGFTSGFFNSGKELHAGAYPGYSLLASPFYVLFAERGMQIANAFISSLLVVFTYKVARLLIKDEKSSVFAAILTLTATPILFYATSMWYHAAVALFYLLVVYSYLSYFENEGTSPVILVSLFTGLMAFTAPYTIFFALPLLVHLPIKMSNRKRLILILSLLLFSMPTILYQHANFGDALTGKYSPSIEPLTKYSKPVWYVFGLEIASYTFFRDFDKRYFYYFIQKSILQSAPYLVLSLMVLLYKRKKPLIILSGVALSVGISSYYYFDYGGMQFSMRYSFPAFPVLVILSVFSLRELKINMENALMLLSIIGFVSVAIMANYWYLELNSIYYNYIKVISSILSVFLIVSSIFYVMTKKHKKIVIFFLILSIFIGIFHNVNDTTVGNSYRQLDHKTREEVANLSGDIYLFPRAAPFDKVVVPGKPVLYYTPPLERTDNWVTEKEDLMRILRENKDKRILAILIKNDYELVPYFKNGTVVKDVVYNTSLFYKEIRIVSMT